MLSETSAADKFENIVLWLRKTFSNVFNNMTLIYGIFLVFANMLSKSSAADL